MKILAKLWKLFVSGLAVVSGAQFARASTPNPNNCVIPQGNYIDSCTQPRMVPYQSSDPNIPTTCELTTTCNTFYDSMAPIKQKYHIPSGTRFNDVTNHNGSLMYNGVELGRQQTSSASDEDCFMPSGSFIGSCNTFLTRYQSTDPNLQQSPLCKAEMNCRTLDGSRSLSKVYFNIATESKNAVQRVENCDGSLVISQEDNRCATQEPSKIREISSREGSTFIKL
jgi:hypothetical protein